MEVAGYKKGVIELAIVNADGNTLFHSLIKNQEPIDTSAFQVHHISAQMLTNVPTLQEVWPDLVPILKSAPNIFTYNAQFDQERLDYTLRCCGIDWDLEQHGRVQWHDLKMFYAEHWGEESWSGYRWRRLELALFQQGITHIGFYRALNDAKAMYKLMECLAQKHARTLVSTEPLVW
jgi:DNA polymerase III epsilon subunit-like protein